MNADQVRAYVNAKWPAAMQSPVALAIGAIIATETAADAMALQRIEAYRHAVQCVESCVACDIEYDEETISHNVECNFPDLSADECDAIAHRAILFS